MGDEYESKIVLEGIGTCKRDNCENSTNHKEYCSRGCWMADNPNKAL